MKKALMIIAAITASAAIGFFGRLLGLSGALIGLLVAIIGAVFITIIIGDKADEKSR